MIKPIEPWVIKIISDNTLVCLRSKKDNMVLNVSYSDFGLRFSTNKVGRMPYFKNAVLKKGHTGPYISGDTTPAKDVYVEKFIPRNFNTYRQQANEVAFTDKAMRLLYGGRVA